MSEFIEGSPGGLNGPGADWQELLAHKCQIGDAGASVTVICPTCEATMGKWTLGCVLCFQAAMAYVAAHAVQFHWRQSLEKVGVVPS